MQWQGSQGREWQGEPLRQWSVGLGHEELLLGLPSGQGARVLGCVEARWSGKPQKVPGKGLCLISAHLLQSKLQSKCLVILQLWCSQQAAEGHAPGHPLGFDGYRQFRPIKVVVWVGGGGDDLPKLVWLRWAAVLRPMAWMTIVRLASADSCVEFWGHIV